MTQKYDADVAIVGYGPTGVIAALTLAKHGISAIAFERHRDIYPRARAVTVNDWTMRIFQNLGVDERVLKEIDPQRALRWMRYDGTEIMRIEHPPSTLGIKPRFFNIYQPTMEAALRECATNKGELIDVRFGFEVVSLEQDETGVTMIAKDTTTGETISKRVRYVIGCDGGSSATRSMIDVKLLGDTIDVMWIVIDCRVKHWWPDRNLLTVLVRQGAARGGYRAFGRQPSLGAAAQARRIRSRLRDERTGLAAAEGAGRERGRCRNSPVRVLPPSHADGRQMARRPCVPRGRRRTPDAALGRRGHADRHARRL